jgi:O-antigen/teichoic acid export membrane protein
MIKKILSDSFLYTLANLFTKGIGFLMIPIYTTFFYTADYGVIDLIAVTGSILSIIVGLEIHQAVARFFPDAKSELEKKIVVSSALWSIVLLYIVFLLISLPFMKNISLLAFNSLEYTDILFVAFLSFGFNFIYNFFSAQLRWQLKSKQNVIVSFIYSLITAILTYTMLKYYDGGISSVFIAQIVAAIVGIILSYLYSKEYYGFVLNIEKFKELFKYSTPLIFSTLIVYAMLYIDRIMINTYLSIEDVGLYGIAFRFASVTTLLTVGIQAALTPLIYNNYKKEDTPQAIATLFSYFILFAILFVGFLFVFSKDIILLFANENYIDSHIVVPWLAISIIFSGITNFAPGIFIEKKTKYILYINIFSFLLNIILNFILIIKFGLLGAAYSTAISSLVYFLLYYYIGQKYYYIPYIWTELNFINKENKI